MFESQDSDITNLKNCVEYYFAFKEYSSGHLHLFLYFLMQKYIYFYHRRLVPTTMFSAKTVSVLVNFIYSSVHKNQKL